MVLIFFIDILFYVPEVRTVRQRQSAAEQQKPLDFLQANAEAIAGGASLQQMAVQSYLKPWQGAERRLPGATGVCRPSPTSGATRRCGLLVVCAKIGQAGAENLSVRDIASPHCLIPVCN